MWLPVAIGLATLVACGGNDAGTLVCTDRSHTFTLAVPPDRLSEMRAHAEASGFSDCAFETGTIARAEPARRTLQLPDRDRSPDLPVDLPPPPPPPPAPTRNLPPTMFEAQRLSGTQRIPPDPETEVEILRSGKARVIGSYKLCVSETGEVTSVRQLKSTGFLEYDAKLIREMQRWTFRPYQINGVDHPACTAYTFIHAVP